MKSKIKNHLQSNVVKIIKPMTLMQMKTYTLSQHSCRIALLIALLFITPTLYADKINKMLANATSLQMTIKRFEVIGKNPLSKKKTQSILQNYVGNHEGVEGIEAAANDLEAALKKIGFAFIRVIIPEQRISSGVIQLRLVEFPIGTINIKGNKHFSKKEILRSVPHLIKGQVPNLKVLNHGLDLANRHPSKQTKLSFAPDADKEKINVTLHVVDRSPVEYSIIINNAGNKETGEYRSSLGFKHNNLFGLDHGISATYTTSPSRPNKIAQYGFNYRLPFYSIGDEINIFLADSDTDIGVVAGGIDIKGTGKIYGANYSHYLSKSNRYQHQIDLSIQDKLFNNDISFQGRTATGASKVRSRPIELKYLATRKTAKSNLNFSLSHRTNIVGGSNSNSTAYNKARQGADPHWSATTLGVAYNVPLSQKVLVNGSVYAQISNEPLISGEKFTMGGSRSLPGFKESELSGDNGYNAKLEVVLAALKNGIQPFASYEQGKVINHNQSNRTTESVSSIGIGLFSQIGKKCFGKLQAGYVLDGIDKPIGDSTADGDSKAHFNLLCSF